MVRVHALLRKASAFIYIYILILIFGLSFAEKIPRWHYKGSMVPHFHAF